ncbi:hypothetical protein BB561_002602 [Smittium simulii]|uniref:CST complex subunit CTC1 n=1 Tax=Smittium simulii TaxID=133385 RepID=A0A2T9YPT7_9FUNG|nr:hypothetical protein BB561_002602 [Smittium simulii]
MLDILSQVKSNVAVVSTLDLDKVSFPQPSTPHNHNPCPKALTHELSHHNYNSEYNGKKLLLLGKIKVCTHDVILNHTCPIFLNAGCVIFEDLSDFTNTQKYCQTEQLCNKSPGQNSYEWILKGPILRVSCKDYSDNFNSETCKNPRFCSSCLVNYLDNQFYKSHKKKYNTQVYRHSSDNSLLEHDVFVLLDSWEYFPAPKNLSGKTKQSWSFLQLTNKPIILPNHFQTFLSKYYHQDQNTYQHSIKINANVSSDTTQNLTEFNAISEIEMWYYLCLNPVTNISETPLICDADSSIKKKNLQNTSFAINTDEFRLSKNYKLPCNQNDQTKTQPVNYTSAYTIIGNLLSISPLYTLNCFNIIQNDNADFISQKFSYYILKINLENSNDKIFDLLEKNNSTALFVLVLGNRLSTFYPFFKIGNTIALTNMLEYVGPMLSSESVPVLSSFDSYLPNYFSNNTQIFFIDCLLKCGYYSYPEIEAFYNLSSSHLKKIDSIALIDNTTLNTFNDLIKNNLNQISYLEFKENKLLLNSGAAKLELAGTNKSTLEKLTFINFSSNLAKAKIIANDNSVVHYHGKITAVIDFKSGIFILDNQIVFLSGSSNFFHPWIPITLNSTVKINNVHTAVIQSNDIYSWELSRQFLDNKQDFLKFEHLAKLKDVGKNQNQYKINLIFKRFFDVFSNSDQHKLDNTSKELISEQNKIDDYISHDSKCKANKIENIFSFFIESNKYIWDKATLILNEYTKGLKSEYSKSSNSFHTTSGLVKDTTIDLKNIIYSSGDIGLSGINLFGFLIIDDQGDIYMEDETLKIPVIILQNTENTNIKFFLNRVEKKLLNLNYSQSSGIKELDLKLRDMQIKSKSRINNDYFFDFNTNYKRVWSFEKYFFSISIKPKKIKKTHESNFSGNCGTDFTTSMKLILNLSDATLVDETPDSDLNSLKNLDNFLNADANFIYVVPKTNLSIKKSLEEKTDKFGNKLAYRFEFLAICANLTYKKVDRYTIFGALGEEYTCFFSIPYFTETSNKIVQNSVYLLDISTGISKTIRRQKCVYFETHPNITNIKNVINYEKYNAFSQINLSEWSLCLEQESFINHFYITSNKLYQSFSSNANEFYNQIAKRIVFHKIKVLYQDISVILNKLMYNNKLGNLAGNTNLKSFGTYPLNIVNIAGTFVSLSIVDGINAGINNNYNIKNYNAQKSLQVSDILKINEHDKANEQTDEEFFKSGSITYMTIMSCFEPNVKAKLYLSSNMLEKLKGVVYGTIIQIKDVTIQSFKYRESELVFNETTCTEFNYMIHPEPLLYTASDFEKIKSYQNIQLNDSPLIDKMLNGDLCDVAPTSFYDLLGLVYDSSTFFTENSCNRIINQREKTIKTLVQIENIHSISIDLRCSICYNNIFSDVCLCFKSYNELEYYYEKNWPIIHCSLKLYMCSTNGKTTYLTNVLDISDVSTILLFDLMTWKSIIKLVIESKSVYNLEYRVDIEKLYYRTNVSLSLFKYSESDLDKPPNTREAFFEIKNLYTYLQLILKRPVIYQSRLLIDAKINFEQLIYPIDFMFMQSTISSSFKDENDQNTKAKLGQEISSNGTEIKDQKTDSEFARSFIEYLKSVYSTIPVPIQCYKVKNVNIVDYSRYLAAKISQDEVSLLVE